MKTNFFITFTILFILINLSSTYNIDRFNLLDVNKNENMDQQSKDSSKGKLNHSDVSQQFIFIYYYFLILVFFFSFFFLAFSFNF